MYIKNLKHAFSDLKKKKQFLTMLLTENNSISCNSKTAKMEACVLLYANWHNEHSSYF